PPAPADRARCRMIEEAVDTQLEAIGWGLMELRVFRRGDEAARAKLEGEAARQIGQFHAFLTRHLGGRPFFAGDIFGRPDMAALPHLLASAKPAEGSTLAAWVARCMARESAKLTAAESQASMAGMAQVGEAVKAGLFKRQYRDHRLEWMMRSGGVEIVRDGMATNTIRFSTELG
ncbi:MAG: glutathione binding-like protein, partial [Alphaproteobacteria bacterium]|nr:glutathione binding-like protein [Alphaproteobacteria bacterium]